MIAIAKGISKVCVLLDAKEVADDLNCCYDRIINPIILNNKYLVPSFDHARFTFVPRSKNGGSHMMAKLNYCLNQNFILDRGRDLRGDEQMALFWDVVLFFLVCCLAYGFLNGIFFT